MRTLLVVIAVGLAAATASAAERGGDGAGGRAAGGAAARAAGVRGLDVASHVTARALASRGARVGLHLARRVRAVRIDLVRLDGGRLVARRDYAVRGGRRVVLRFRVRTAQRLAGHGPYELRVRGGRSLRALRRAAVRTRLHVVSSVVPPIVVATPGPRAPQPTPTPVRSPEATPVPAPAPAPAPAGYVAVGDTCGAHCGEVAGMIRSLAPYRFLHTGDYQYGNAGAAGSAFIAGYQQIFAGLHEITIPSFGGTHDTCDGSGAWECYPVTFFDADGAPEVRGKLQPGGWGYSVDLPAGWHLLNLNYRAPDLARVAADLAGRRGQCVIAVVHAPVLGSPSTNHPTNEGAVFAGALDAGGADLILSGHQHFYERNAYAQGTAFTVGTGGVTPYARTAVAASSRAYASGQYGVLELQLDPGAWSARYVTTAGQVLDSASGDCTD